MENKPTAKDECLYCAQCLTEITQDLDGCACVKCGCFLSDPTNVLTVSMVEQNKARVEALFAEWVAMNDTKKRDKR